MTAPTSSAPQPPSSTPGEVERLVGIINEYAEAIRMHERSLHRSSAEGVEAAAWWWSRWQQSAQTIKDIISHISTAGRGEGAESRDAGRALKDALFACLKEGGADRQYGGVLTEGGKYAWVRFTREAPAADATNPQDQE